MSLKFSNPTSSGGGGGGTVTNVSSANSDIGVSSGTTTPILTLSSAAIIAKPLTGYVSGAGTVAATDSILQAIQKLNGNDATNANLTGDITSVGNTTAIAAGVIVNADINASAAIDATKIADGSVTSAEFQFINSLTSNAQTQINAKANKAQSAWITPTLLNGWVDYETLVVGTSYSGAKYMKDEMGYVHIDGLIKSGASGTIFTLPVGYRPLQRITFLSACNSGSDTFSRTTINPNGTIDAGAATGFLSIFITPFLAEQ